MLDVVETLITGYCDVLIEHYHQLANRKTASEPLYRRFVCELEVLRAVTFAGFEALSQAAPDAARDPCELSPDENPPIEGEDRDA